MRSTIAIGLVPLLFVGCSAVAGVQPGASRSGGNASNGGASSGGAGVGGEAPNEAGLREFLRGFVPGSLHEAKPHGVPSNYDWSTRAQSPSLEPPNGETVANFWGQIYVDESGVIAPNVRVEVQGTSFLALYEGSSEWVVVQTSDALGGGAWEEDFHTQCDAPAYDARNEADGGTSFITAAGCNAHYWPSFGQSDIEETRLVAPIVVGFTRLVATDPEGADHLDESTYLNGVGADWRAPRGACPTPPESSVPVCSPIGIGKFIVVERGYRTMVFSTLDAAALETLPLPPLEYFEQPDGRYFR